jgi:hypothetical protein
MDDKDAERIRQDALKSYQRLKSHEHCLVCLQRDGRMMPADGGAFGMGGANQTVDVALCKAHAKEWDDLHKSTEPWMVSQELLAKWVEANCPSPLVFFQKSK